MIFMEFFELYLSFVRDIILDSEVVCVVQNTCFFGND